MGIGLSDPRVWRASADLDTVPAVDAFLVRLGVGAYDRSTLAAPSGRNDVWTGRTTTGRGIFVKHLRGPAGDVRDRMHRILSFERFRAGATLPDLRAPALLGVDHDHDLVAFELVEDATTGVQMLVEDTFSDADGRRVGAALAALHRSQPPPEARLDASPALPPVRELLDGLPLAMVELASGAELEVWRLLQGDSELAGALEVLRDRERAAAPVPVHADLRIDQLLFVGPTPWITDWEEFRLGDPARDVGGFAGEWLHRAVLDIVTNRGDAETAFLDVTLDHETVLSRGVAKIQRLRPRVEHFWAAYTAGRPDLDPDFAERAAAYAGWHLIDRLMASGHRRSRLSGIERAAAGVGRAVLLAPARFSATIGLGAAA